jgi:hypothetical protein
MENLNSLDLVAIKSLCKKYGIGTIGEKKELIKKLKYFLDPIDDVLNTHPGRKLPPEKKIIGIKLSERNLTKPLRKKVNSYIIP